MKRLLALTAAAALLAGAASAYDAATCTEKLTGSWTLAVEGASLTLHLKAGGDITVEAVAGAGQKPEIHQRHLDGGSRRGGQSVQAENGGGRPDQRRRNRRHRQGRQDHRTRRNGRLHPPIGRTLAAFRSRRAASI
ncbi:MAG: hypothetical protein QM698_12210 [Micropepsaceae bacterium]